MHTINLVSLLNAHEALNTAIFERYLNTFGINNMREHEIDSLKLLVQNIAKCNIPQDEDHIAGIYVLDEYYVGYSIPQIGKEFDLLKFGINSIINIELKKESDEEKVLKQLSRNRYYLSFLDKNIFCFTYLSDKNKLYQLVDEEGSLNLREIGFSTLYGILNNVEIEHLANIDTLFDPSNYLVSPFNSTQRFIDSEYFLTKHQENIKNIITTWIDPQGDNFISLTGSAGTGKTLLIYDIAKELLYRKYRVLIIHCGNLNEGQCFLNANYQWEIHRVKNGYGKDFREFDLIIIDEVQRIYPAQLDTIINKVREADIKCIFSYDGNQCLSPDEIKWNNVEKIEKLSSHILKLTDKIRTNKEIAFFIRQLINKKINLEKHDYPNVEVSYFNNYNDAKAQLMYLREKGWKVTNYTPGVRRTYYYETLYNIPNEHDTPHSIIGQEFDSVVAVIDHLFYYDAQGRLAEHYSGISKYYSQYGMLYQILTRTRKKVHLVIIKNEKILIRCLDILGQKQKNKT